jgi:hypothetical protein
MSWKGYYVQCAKQHEMHFDNLEVQAGPGGLIHGAGSDTVGSF